MSSDFDIWLELPDADPWTGLLALDAALERAPTASHRSRLLEFEPDPYGEERALRQRGPYGQFEPLTRDEIVSAEVSRRPGPRSFELWWSVRRLAWVGHGHAPAPGLSRAVLTTFPREVPWRRVHRPALANALYAPGDHKDYRPDLRPEVGAENLIRAMGELRALIIHCGASNAWLLDVDASADPARHAAVYHTDPGSFADDLRAAGGPIARLNTATIGQAAARTPEIEAEVLGDGVLVWCTRGRAGSLARFFETLARVAPPAS